MPQYELTLRDYWRIFRKRKFIVIATTVLTGLLSFFFATFRSPLPLYESAAAVRIEESRDLAGYYYYPFTAWGMGANIATQTKIVTSFPVMEKVAKRTGHISENLTPEEIRADPDLLKVVLDVRDMVSCEQEDDTNIIAITAITADPRTSQLLANTVAEVYREEHMREKGRRVVEARKFIEAQLERVEAELRRSEEEVREFRETHQIISLDSQTNITLDRLTAVEEQERELKRQVAQMREMLEQLSRHAETLGGKLESLVGESPGSTFTMLYEKVLDLYIQRDALLLEYTTEHPEVRELDARIKEGLSGMIKEVQSSLTSLEDKLEGVVAERVRLRANYEDLPESGLMLARLDRTVDTNKAIYTDLQTRYQEVLIKEAERVEEVTVIRPAVISDEPINPPKVPILTFLGTVIGLVLGAVLGLIYETLDTSIGAIEDVEGYLQVPVLGVIPHVTLDEIVERPSAHRAIDVSDLPNPIALVSLFAPLSPLSESLRSLRTNLMSITDEDERKTMLVTSSTYEEGKSTIITNLAITFAQMGSKTLLVDADMRQPHIYRAFGVELEPGLSDIIVSTYQLNEATRACTDLMMGAIGLEGLLMTPGIDNLYLITSGSYPLNPSELLHSQRMTELIAQMRELYDVVLFDSPPILPATDAAVLGAKVEQTLIVYQVGKASRGSLMRAKVAMESAKAKIAGVVLNQLTPEVSADFQDFGYYRHYGYGEERRRRRPGVGDRVRSLIGRQRETSESPPASRRAPSATTRLVLLAAAIVSLLGGLVLL